MVQRYGPDVTMSIADDGDYVAYADYEKVINSREKRYREGYEDGIRAYAWWKDGIQYVGSCGTTLEQALKKTGKG